MNIFSVTDNKKFYIDLLLLADENEAMIDKYIDRGDMYVLDDAGIKAECIVTDEGDGLLELKNIAVVPECQHMGYGRALLKFIEEGYSAEFHTIQVGTGDSELTIPFYIKCGFVVSHRVPNFFVDNYPNPIFECGVRLIDMVYLKKDIAKS